MAQDVLAPHLWRPSHFQFLVVSSQGRLRGNMVAMKKTVMKKKAVTTKASGTLKKGADKFKLRLGICVGKDFDPVKKGTQPPNFPKELILTNDDWGKYSVDAVTALKMKELHPDLIDIDIIPGAAINRKRLVKNHVN